MGIRVRLYSRLKEAVGRDEIILDQTPKNVGELIEDISKIFGEDFKKIVYQDNRLRDNLMILVNGHSIKLLKGLETPLTETDNISIDVIDLVEIIGGG
ncbi:MAG: MoaD family protein [Aigarchaeota archaeon]|nr:MoaD family protein [Aigarchaeota archaeon]MCX8192883.1 MoaD family protein [Nitrososphaeria archaeon]MDW7986472.1 MoaD family protein [Nitrososphaerota archaeon]